ncbi:MAG: GNAT family N-acetyltransferase [Candidatus Rokuibacteriota bacterium]
MIRVRTLCLYERQLDTPVTQGPLPPGVELAVWDAPPAAGDAGRPWQPEAERRIREGQVCVVARHGGEVIAYCWLTWRPEWVAEVDRLVVPGPDEAYLYEAFTEPGWRGRGLFPAMLFRLLSYAWARGRRRALIFVLTNNRASRRAIEKGGFELFQTVSKVELGGLRRLLFRGPRAGRARVTLVRRTDGT